jgi:hypothetical protein
MALNWTEWFEWSALRTDGRKVGALKVPAKPGVYEAKYSDAERCLHIGQTANLLRRVKQAMVKGKLPHAAGERIRAEEDVSKIVVRWAETDHCEEIERQLHEEHRGQFGKMPKHDRRS